MPANRQEGLGPGDSLIQNTIYHLLNFEKYTSFPDALRGAALANDFQMILLSTDLHPVFSVETRHRTTIGAAVRLSKECLVDGSEELYVRLDVNGIITYWGMVRVQGQPYRMFLVDNEDVHTAADMTRLGKLVELAMEMWHFSPEQDARSEFLRALRRNNAAQAYSLRGEAGIDPASICGVFLARGDQAAAESLLEQAEEAGLTVLRTREEEEFYGILLADGDPQALLPAANEAYRTGQLEDRAVLYHVTGIQGPEGAGTAFALIQEARDAAAAIWPHQAVLDRYELALARSAAVIQEQDPVQRQEYSAWFDPFKDLTPAKRRQFLETLEVFVLDAGRSTQRTAELLGIHTNTVQYRLHRVEEKMGINLLQGPGAPGLVLALALRRLGKAGTKGRP